MKTIPAQLRLTGFALLLAAWNHLPITTAAPVNVERLDIIPEALSHNGDVVVGLKFTEDGRVAYCWTRKNGSMSLGDLPGGEVASRARAVSGDGRPPGVGRDALVALGTLQLRLLPDDQVDIHDI